MNEPTTIDTTALDRLRAKAELAAAPIWRPQPGDTLEGVLVGSRMAEGPFGEQRQALIPDLPEPPLNHSRFWTARGTDGVRAASRRPRYAATCRRGSWCPDP